MKMLGVMNIYLLIVRVGLHFLDYSRWIEERMVDYVLKSLVCYYDVGIKSG